MSLLGLLCALVGAVPAALAQLRIDITSGVTDPIPIAVVKFAAEPADGRFDYAEVIQQDLERSGRFRLLPRERMPAAPIARRCGSRGRLACASAPTTCSSAAARRGPVGGQSVVDFELLNVLNGQRLLSERITVPHADARATARTASLTGSTRRSSACAARSRRASPTSRSTARRPASATS